MTNLPIKTRFAPSPTGPIHLGNCRTALLSALYAKHGKGLFLLRIEDTDTERSSERYADTLIADLRWLGIEWQEGPYWQSQRSAIYQSYYDKLSEQHRTYPCFCSEAELMLTRKLQLSLGKPSRYPGTCRGLSASAINAKLATGLRPTLRFRMPANVMFEFNDLVRGHQRFAANDIGDFIIRRADGGAIFMFCNAIDDALLGVTHVIRGEDHLANTPRQMAILQALTMPVPHYGHLALILATDGSKLSKRNGSRSIEELREMGYLPSAVINYLARLGHYYESNKLMSYSELTELFSTQHLSVSSAHFDEQQLLYWQKQALQQTTNAQLWSVTPIAVRNRVPENRRDAFANLVKPNILFPQEMEYWAETLFTETLTYTAEAQTIIATTLACVFEVALTALQSEEYHFTKLAELVKRHTGVKGKALFQPLRVALTGSLHGPEMAAITEFLGAERMAQRFKQALHYQQHHPS